MQASPSGNSTKKARVHVPPRMAISKPPSSICRWGKNLNQGGEGAGEGSRRTGGRSDGGAGAQERDTHGTCAHVVRGRSHRACFFPSALACDFHRTGGKMASWPLLANLGLWWGLGIVIERDATALVSRPRRGCGEPCVPCVTMGFWTRRSRTVSMSSTWTACSRIASMIVRILPGVGGRGEFDPARFPFPWCGD